MNILNIEHISKMFGEKQIFDDVSYGMTKSASWESTAQESPLS